MELRNPHPPPAAAFRRALAGHPNRQLVACVVNGLHEGFDANVDAPGGWAGLVNHLRGPAAGGPHGQVVRR